MKSILLRHALFLVLALGSTASCASKRKAGADDYPPVRVYVENQNFYDATVYLRWNGNQRRLGIAAGHDQENFTTAWLGPQVTLEISLLAGRRYRGDTIGVSPGDELVIVIPVDPAQFRVYRRSP